MKKVLMVLDKEFPSDERVEKEIRSLQENGFTVAIAVYTFGSRPLQENFNGYTIYRKPISKFTFKSSAAILVMPHYFRFWYAYLDEILRKDKFDIIHIHDLPLSGTGYEMAVKYNLKLVCDQHEFYSNWIVRTNHYNTLPGKIIRLFSNWIKYEKESLSKADLVITVADSLKKLYIDKVGIRPDKIITLPNTPGLSVFNYNNVDPSVGDRFKGRYILFYAGGLDHLRGIEFVIEALQELKKTIPEILFVIAGKENRSFNLQELIRHHHAEENVVFAGWLPLKELPSYIAMSHICVFVPRADNLEINNTIVTKIYQYASMGKPIIVSEAALMKKFVETNRIGYSVPYGNIPEFCEKVKFIKNHPELDSLIRANGVNIAEQNSWENTSVEFIERYKEL
jgi:glycosyltransferase involved in cell wall biosynthesis